MVINIKRATHARSISNKIHYLGLCAHINLCVNIVKQNTSADERDEVYTLTADGWDGEPSFIVTFSNKKRQCLNDNGTGALAAFKTYDPRGNKWMDVFVHSTLCVQQQLASISAAAHIQRERGDHQNKKIWQMERII